LADMIFQRLSRWRKRDARTD